MGAHLNQNRLYCITMLLLAAGSLPAGCARGPSFRAYTLEGQQLMAEGRFASARAMFLAAHDMSPQNVVNLCNLGDTHLAAARQRASRGDDQGAAYEAGLGIKYFRRAIQYYPGYADAISGLNRSLEMSGRDQEALETAEWASTILGPNARRQLFLAGEYAQRGDADRALLSYRQAVAMEPANPTPYWALGRFYLTVDRRDEGIENLQQAYRLDPTRLYVADELRRLGAEVPDMSPVNLES